MTADTSLVEATPFATNNTLMQPRARDVLRCDRLSIMPPSSADGNATRVRFTCLAASCRFLVLGATTGTLYFYRRIAVAARRRAEAAAAASLPIVRDGAAVSDGIGGGVGGSSGAGTAVATDYSFVKLVWRLNTTRRR